MKTKNPDLKDLGVAVVPTETGNGINQSSTVEEILACKETELYSVPDYFKAQNDEEIPLMHWSFLIDISKNEDCTGMNTDGIDYYSNSKGESERDYKIRRIKDILSVWGKTTASELELEASPCISSTGTNKNNISVLVEEFYPNGVTAITYQNENEIDEVDMDYEDLSDDIIDEIAEIIDRYEAEQLKTEKRCSN